MAKDSNWQVVHWIKSFPRRGRDHRIINKRVHRSIKTLAIFEGNAKICIINGDNNVNVCIPDTRKR